MVLNCEFSVFHLDEKMKVNRLSLGAWVFVLLDYPVISAFSPYKG